MNANRIHAIRSFRHLGLALLATLAGSAAGPDAGDTTYDGLVPIRAQGLENAWAKPDIDLSRYDTILLAPVEFEFRAVRPAPVGASSTSEFPVSPADRQRLAEIVTTVFREELARSQQFRLAEEPGPGALRLEVALQDIVSRVPPERPGRSDIYLDRVGEATLVLELSDSMNGEILARAVDRRAAETFAGGLSSGVTLANRVDSVTAWSEVRQLAQRWARVVTRRLDQLAARSRMPDEEATTSPR